ncbi:hypothetical protein LJK88_30860 [Paenibacillus sp. P26]|nr:hypothetical protein LJK88_30860 [Paenibacillus sp. P26]UUZ94355.1 hypothetical protein LJK87_07210 [Paenibacillus sp. P25]
MTMLKVDHCPKCGKVYQKNLRNLCQSCIDSYEDDYNRCNAYLRDHRKSTNAELSQATGVSERQIIGFIKENKLPIGSYPHLHYPCSSCRAPIRQHHLCSSCSIRISKEIRHLQEQEAKKERGSGFQIRERIWRS